MQTYYPIFESGQVLTNAHLNQMLQWLNEQELAGRRKLFGIGIVCGLDVAREGNHILLSGGVAVTSAGHLMVQASDRELTQYRGYEIPISQAVEDESEIDAQEVSQLLPVDDIAMWELFGPEAEAGVGETPLADLNEAFMQDKALMLLLEAKQESLKNCDVNSCADKGARMQFTLRTLLISEADAIRLWQAETAQQEQLYPRDLNWQALEKQLKPTAIRKLVCSASGIDSMEQIAAQIQTIVQNGWLGLGNQLQGSFDVYAYLLRDYFPTEQFPTDPWTDAAEVLSSNIQTVEDLMLNMHHYDLLRDAVASYNEFIDCAKEYEALCCPSEKRFEYHVLLGKAGPPKNASPTGNQTPAAINFNLGAQAGLPYLRHHFIPNPQLQAQCQCAEKLANLYYRTWLIFQRYQTDQLLEKDIRISPSQLHAPLSGQALPYYLALNRLDDLHRNWNPMATRKAALDLVHGYHVNPGNPHPLVTTPLAHDFYRIEGLIGKPLGQTIADLRLQKNQLGLSFAIEPVFLPLKSFDDAFSRASVLQFLMRDQSLMRLFKCKISDLDTIFVLVLAVLFQLVLGLLYLMARLKPATGQLTGASHMTHMRRFPVDERSIDEVIVEMDESDFNDTARLKFAQERFGQSSEDSEFFHRQLKDGNLMAEDVLDALDEEDDPNGANAVLYKRVEQQNSRDLYERVKAEVGADTEAQDLEEAYQSMRMMQQSEKMMDQLSVQSLAQFDFDQFDASLNELSEAHIKLLRVQARDKDTSKALMNGVRSQVGMLSTLARSSMLSNLQVEFKKRLESIFSEFMFDGFNKKHPGLEHLCGVPKGGTLVLAYCHKDLLAKYTPPTNEPPAAGNRYLTGADLAHMAPMQPEFDERANAFIERVNRYDESNEIALAHMMAEGRHAPETLHLHVMEMAKATRKTEEGYGEVAYPEYETGPRKPKNTPKTFNATEAINRLGLSKAARKEDPLNDMVVLMDFCLPTFCCDSECSDLEMAQREPSKDEERRPTRVTISGRIVANLEKSLAMGKQVSTIPAAKLEVVDRKNKPVPVTMTRGAFLFKVKAGEYKVTASAEGFQSKTENTMLKQSQSDVIIRLDRNRKG